MALKKVKIENFKIYNDVFAGTESRLEYSRWR
jgi:hypothetical protein